MNNLPGFNASLLTSRLWHRSDVMTRTTAALAGRASEPCAETMERHIVAATVGWEEHLPRCKFEIRCIHPDLPDDHPRKVRAQNFQLGDARRAAQWAASLNRQRWNCYRGINPRRSDIPRHAAAKAGDVPAAMALASDQDTALEPLERVAALPLLPYFLAFTGYVPGLRVQSLWRLQEPLSGEEPWKSMQRGLAARVGGDPRVCDLPRVMRLPGSVSYPPAHKRARGYQVEQVTLFMVPGAPPHISLHEARSLSDCAAPDMVDDDDWTSVVDRPGLPPPSMRRLRSALAWVPPDDRDIWVRVGGALKAHAAETGEDIVELFVEWSRGDMRHDGPRVPTGFKGADDCLRLLKTLTRDEVDL